MAPGAWAARAGARRGPWLAAYGVLLLSALAVRAWSTREVLPTLGADTYHHTLIALLIAERGGLPSDYAPYAAIDSFAYHFGFHAFAAWVHWLSGADFGALVGLTGHLVNAAVALGAALFVRRRLHDDPAALMAAWLVAWLCVFPAYFVNWGRYTQAAGLVLLPVAAALWLDLLAPRGRLSSPGGGARGWQTSLPLGVAAALCTAGLFLAHYRMAAVLATLLAVWLALAPPGIGARWSLDARLLAWRDAAARGLPVGLLSVALLLPWLARLAGQLGLGLGERPGDYGADYYALERLGGAPAQPTNWLLLPLALAGLLLAWRGRQTAVPLLAAWAIVQLALASPVWWPVPMPLAGRVDLVSVVATLCLPLAVAASYALAVLVRAARHRWPRAALPTAVLAGILATALGAWQLLALVTPDNALVTAADLAAVEWVRANTPPEARFAAATTLFPWAPDYAVGIDAGYWLPLLAGRATTVLPMLYPAERGTDGAAAREMVAVGRALRDAPAAPETAALLRAHGVTHLFIGARAPTPGPPAGADYALVYERDGVRVLAVRSP